MIEVRIPTNALLKNPNEVQIGVYALKQLAAAGIPVTGSLFPRGVSRGSLTVFEDCFDGAQVYQFNESTPS